MNTLGMFYADEAIYIFETPSAELIHVPLLSAVMDEALVLYENPVLFVHEEWLPGREE